MHANIDIPLSSVLPAWIVRLFGGEQKPPADKTLAKQVEQLRTLVEQLQADQQQDRDAMAKALEAQATAHTAALETQATAHRAEIVRLEELYRERMGAQEKLFDERLKGQRDYIGSLQRSAEQSTLLAMTQHESIGTLQEGLRRSEKGGEKQGERIGRLEQEMLTGQRQIVMLQQIGLDLEEALAKYEPERPRQVLSISRLIALPPPVVTAPAPEEVAPHE